MQNFWLFGCEMCMGLAPMVETRVESSLCFRMYNSQNCLKVMDSVFPVISEIIQG